MKNLVLLLFILKTCLLTAQNLPNLKKEFLVESYKMTTLENFIFDDSSIYHDLTPLEKLDVKQEETRSQVNIYSVNGIRVTEKIFLQQVDHPKWMKLPQKTILTETDAWSIDEEGEIISHVSIPKADKEEKRADERLVEYYANHFIPMSDGMIRNKARSGLAISKINPHQYVFESRGLTREWDTQKLMSKSTFQDDLGNHHLRITKKFKKISSGKLIPSWQHYDKTLTSRNNNHKYIKQSLTVYTDYQIGQNKNTIRDLNLLQEADFVKPHIINTVVQTELMIQVPMIEIRELQLEIFDLNGQSKLRRTYASPKFVESLHLDGLTPGLYFCRLSHSGIMITQKFILQ